jgi:hypothetical protein
MAAVQDFLLMAMAVGWHIFTYFYWRIGKRQCEAICRLFGAAVLARKDSLWDGTFSVQHTAVLERDSVRHLRIGLGLQFWLAKTAGMDVSRNSNKGLGWSDWEWCSL